MKESGVPVAGSVRLGAVVILVRDILGWIVEGKTALGLAGCDWMVEGAEEELGRTFRN